MIRVYRIPRWVRRWYGQVQFTVPQADQEIALTFDDGPDRRYTVPVLDILDRYQVKATFFLEGAKVEQARELVREIAGRGHALGNHFYSHDHFVFKRRETLRDQLRRTAALIGETVGLAPGLVRPPFGYLSRRVVRLISAEGAHTVLWTVMPYDFTNPGARVITERTIRWVENGSIIVLHDGGGDRAQTVEALPRIIERLSRDYAWVRLDRRDQGPECPDRPGGFPNPREAS